MLGSLVVGAGIAVIVAGVALRTAATTGIPDWQYTSVLAGVVLLAEVVTLGLLARLGDWRKAFESAGGGWRISIATSAIAFGGYATVVWLMLILGGLLTVPDFATGSGRGWARDTLIGLFLLAGPLTTLVLLAATANWRAVLAASVPIRAGSAWILGIAIFSGLALLPVFSAAEGGGQLVAVLLALLLPPSVGLGGLLARREWGRSATTMACFLWASTGIGLVFSAPLLLMLWFRRPVSSDPSAMRAGARSDLDGSEMRPSDEVGIWAIDLARGDTPPICVKSGRPADRNLKFRFGELASGDARFFLALFVFGAFAFLGGPAAAGPLPLTRRWHTALLLLRLTALAALPIGLVVLLSTAAMPQQLIPTVPIVGLVFLGLYVVSHTVYAGLRPKGAVHRESREQTWVQLRDVHPNFVAAVKAREAEALKAAGISPDGNWFWDGASWTPTTPTAAG